MRLLKTAVLFKFLGDIFDFISTFLFLHLTNIGEGNDLMVVDGHFSIPHAIYLKTLFWLYLILVAKFIHVGTKSKALAALPFAYAGWTVWSVVVSNFAVLVLSFK